MKIDRNIFFFFLGKWGNLNNINTSDVDFGCSCKFMDIFMDVVKGILALNFS